MRIGKRMTALLLAALLLLCALPLAAFGQTGELLPITLEQIAELNGCSVSELNITYDENGRITFIGNRFSTEKIQNEDDAIAMLEALGDLASIDVDLSFYKVQKSTVSDLLYYSFYQTEEYVFEDGTSALFDCDAACIKLITDEAGNTVGLSACLGNQSAPKNYTAEDVLTREEAEAVVQRQCDEGEHVYPEYTTLAYLEDEGAISAAGYSSKRMPVWIVMTDYSLVSGCNGTAYCVDVLKSGYFTDAQGAEHKNAQILQFVPVREPSAAGLDGATGIYTSLVFFDNMQDAGTLSIHTNESEWLVNCPEGYTCRDVTYTVPMMYDTVKQRYVLGDYNRKILVTDGYTYLVQQSAVPNMIVSETPGDLSSWHWSRPTATMKDGTEQALHLNIVYAAANLQTIVTIKDNYYKILGIDSFDGEGLPLLLTLYMTKNGIYPANPADFTNNASCYHAVRDWGVIATSPANEYGADITVIGHEYAHGVNSSNSSIAAYHGVTGSVEEAFADILSLSVYSAATGEDHLVICECIPENAMRSLQDPEFFCKPKYIGGKYYLDTEIDPMDETILDWTDRGGVHYNNGATNYLAYSLSTANPAARGTAFGWEEIARLWYEASLCRTTDFHYDELGAYLLFSAGWLGLSEEKYNTLRDYLYAFGFCVDKSGLETTLRAEGITVRQICSESNIEDSPVTLCLNEEDEAGRLISMTILPASGAKKQCAYIEGTNTKFSITPFSKYCGGPNSRCLADVTLPESFGENRDIRLRVVTVNVAAGTDCHFNEPLLIQDRLDENVCVPTEKENSYRFSVAGEYFFSGTEIEDGCLLIYHIIIGTAEEIAEANHSLKKAAADGELHTVPFRVVNRSSYSIETLQFAMSSSDSWGSEILGGKALAPGESLTGSTITYSLDTLEWDMQIKRSDGKEYSWAKNSIASCKVDTGVNLILMDGEDGGIVLRVR